MPARETPSHAPTDALRELERAERLIAALPGDLLKQERLAAVGLLSAFLAHECRNRLTPIVGYARAAARAPHDRDLVTRALGRIAASAQELANLSELILSSAVPESAEADIQACWNRAKEELAARATHDGVEIHEVLDGDLRASMPAAALTHVLENLLRNAVTASDHGQTITLFSRSTRNTITLFLVDSADGMPPGPTTALTSGTGSTGLGLALCRYLVELSGGRVEVVSERGEGTTIVVELPRAAQSG